MGREIKEALDHLPGSGPESTISEWTSLEQSKGQGANKEGKWKEAKEL